MLPQMLKMKMASLDVIEDTVSDVEPPIDPVDPDLEVTVQEEVTINDDSIVGVTDGNGRAV